MMTRSTIAAMIALGAWTGASIATEPWVSEILQPIVLPDGIVLSHVTYAGYYEPDGTGLDRGAARAALTCRPNAVQTNSGMQNANAASMAGFAVRARGGCAPETDLGVCGDTLKLELHVPDSIPAESPLYVIDGSTATLDKLVAATVECVLVNAAASGSDVKHIMLRLAGPARFTRYSRIYRAADYRAGPHKRVFD